MDEKIAAILIGAFLLIGISSLRFGDFTKNVNIIIAFVLIFLYGIMGGVIFSKLKIKKQEVNKNGKRKRTRTL